MTVIKYIVKKTKECKICNLQTYENPKSRNWYVEEILSCLFSISSCRLPVELNRGNSRSSQKPTLVYSLRLSVGEVLFFLNCEYQLMVTYDSLFHSMIETLSWKEPSGSSSPTPGTVQRIHNYIPHTYPFQSISYVLNQQQIRQLKHGLNGQPANNFLTVPTSCLSRHNTCTAFMHINYGCLIWKATEYHRRTLILFSLYTNIYIFKLRERERGVSWSLTYTLVAYEKAIGA